jgi:hypothetical protein
MMALPVVVAFTAVTRSAAIAAAAAEQAGLCFVGRLH